MPTPCNLSRKVSRPPRPARSPSAALHAVESLQSGTNTPTSLALAPDATLLSSSFIPPSSALKPRAPGLHDRKRGRLGFSPEKPSHLLSFSPLPFPTISSGSRQPLENKMLAGTPVISPPIANDNIFLQSLKNRTAIVYQNDKSCHFNRPFTPFPEYGPTLLPALSPSSQVTDNLKTTPQPDRKSFQKTWTKVDISLLP